MKTLRIGIITVFIIVSVAFAFIFVHERRSGDDTYPTIKCEDKILEVSPQPDIKELLKGITAYDEKDGDITDRIVVESVSKFKSFGVSTVTYAVSDSDMHVVKLERDIKYKGYRKPKFTLNQALVYNTNSRVELGDAIGAQDVLDGDISENVVITVDKTVKQTKGKHIIDVSVTNSKGDTATLKLPVYVESQTYSTPKPELSEYLIYIKKGTWIDPRSYILPGQENFEITIDSDLDTSKTGVYKIEYHAKDFYGGVGHSVLNVVVEE